MSLEFMNESADANQILFTQLPDNGRRPRGRPRSTWIWNVCNDLSSFGMDDDDDYYYYHYYYYSYKYCFITIIQDNLH